MENKRFVPEDRGRLVTAFLTSFFERYVDTGFTSGLEAQLDEVSDGKLDWHALMRAFWDDFSKAIEQTRELKISDVIDALDRDLGPHFFTPREDGTDPRLCPSCHQGRLGLKLGRHGSFIGCSRYPECQFTRRLAIEGGEAMPKSSRTDCANSATTLTPARTSPSAAAHTASTPSRASRTPPTRKASPAAPLCPKAWTATPSPSNRRSACSPSPPDRQTPGTGQDMEAGLGRFGPYIKMGSIFASLDKDDDILSIGVNRAVDVIGRKLASVRILGQHPKDRADIQIRKGRFGPYAQHGQTVANLLKHQTMDDITLEDAIALLAERGKVLAAPWQEWQETPPKKPPPRRPRPKQPPPPSPW